MFTGLITEIGRVASVVGETERSLRIEAPETACGLLLGASVACSGICLTATCVSPEGFEACLSAETLSKTTAAGWTEGTCINLERALRLNEELGGHLVSGHVDGIARVVLCAPEGESLRLRLEIPDAFAKFVAPKGSIALDGVSLTVNEVQGAELGVNIIPHTQDMTTLGQAQKGDLLNFEIDPVARYVGRILEGKD